MLGKLADLIKKEVSKDLAFNHVLEITQHHRIQSSPGYRAAAQYAHDYLEKTGLETETLSYAGDGKTKYWEYTMPEEWYADSGMLKLIKDNGEEEVLADFEKVPLSLIQRSCATPKAGVTGELIVLDRGDEESAYKKVDFNGKFVLTDGDYDKVRSWAVEKRGAIGVITDRMSEFPPIRHRYDIGDALTYTSYWWYGHEKKCIGFVLSPKAGDALRKKAANGPIKLWAKVEAKFNPKGKIEVTTGLIRGKTDEEILIVSHLCHPQPSANDNATGNAVTLESARVLQKLIDNKVLPVPKRSIRFMLVPEMTGTYAYLANNTERIEKTVAGLNLDMVGENQELCGSSLIVEQIPHATKHFAGSAAKEALMAITNEVPNLAGTSSYALFRYTVGDYSGGSDHYILSDPTVNIGTPMLIQWPDKFYHTSMDTPDKVDPAMLARVSTITSVYAYFLATAGQQEAYWLSRKMLADAKMQAASYYNDALAAAFKAVKAKDAVKLSQLNAEVPEKLNYLNDLAKGNIASLVKLSAKMTEYTDAAGRALDENLRRLRKEWAADFKPLVKDVSLPPYRKKTSRHPLWSAVLMRNSRGPISLRGQLERLDADLFDRYHAEMKLYPREARKMTQMLYWMDGERSLAEIGQKLLLETGSVEPRALVIMAEVLLALGYISHKK